MSEIVFAIITTARAEGWLDGFIDAVIADRPDNPELRQWAADVLWPARRESPDIGTNLERTIRAHAPELDPAVFRRRLARMEARVCRIDAETPSGYVALGTGFLIGADLCVTACHVIDGVLAGKRKPEDLRLRFADQVYRLDDNWLAAHAPRSPVDESTDPGDRLPEAQQLDFAVLRAVDSPGKAILGSGEPRGWISAVRERALEQHDELVILQHLEGEPLSLAFGAAIDFNANHTRLRHTVNTAHGSSGAPCFDINLDLVAMHQGGDPDKRRNHLPTHNLSVPFRSIQRVLPAPLDVSGWTE